MIAFPKEKRIEWLKTCTGKQRDEYYQSVVNLGCAACGSPYRPEGPNRTALHHCVGHGFPAKREHRPVIGLCAHDCHQGGRLAIHRGKATFEMMYGMQEELLAKVEARL